MQARVKEQQSSKTLISLKRAVSIGGGITVVLLVTLLLIMNNRLTSNDGESRIPESCVQGCESSWRSVGPLRNDTRSSPEAPYLSLLTAVRAMVRSSDLTMKFPSSLLRSKP